MTDIWILGGAGRSGSLIAAHLAAAGAAVVLVGRDKASLDAVAQKIGGNTRVVVAASGAIRTELANAGPVVVANMIGPFAQTAVPTIRACAPGSHYLDLSNELAAAEATLALHGEAVAANRCLVTGAGWGVTGAESVVLHLCKDKPPPQSVRVDVAPFVGGEGGPMGHTLAETIIDSIPAGTCIYENGRKVRVGLGSRYEHFTAPDGMKIGTGAVAMGDLEAARRASGAATVISASTFVPGSPVVRALIPLVTGLMASRALRQFASRRVAKVNIPPPKETKPTWARARATWADGTTREAWLRTGDASDFTAKAAAQIALRLARGEGKPGAYTPCALFGSDLAIAAGGEFQLG